VAAPLRAYAGRCRRVAHGPGGVPAQPVKGSKLTMVTLMSAPLGAV
jgi:hypothetical protein